MRREKQRFKFLQKIKKEINKKDLKKVKYEIKKFLSFLKKFVV